MKHATIRRTVLAATILGLVGSSGRAQIQFTETGSIDTVKAGFPWVLPETNYRFAITTDGTDGKVGGNAGDGTLNDGLTENLNIPAWRDFASFPQVQITGVIPASGLTLGDGAVAGSWLEIGLISKKQAERAADWYLSGMFNQSVFVGFQNWGGQYSAFPGDVAGGDSTPIVEFDPTKALAYELTIFNTNSTVSLRINNGNGWSAPISMAFGADNWGWSGYQDDLSQAALIVQMYAADGSGTSAATFGNIQVFGIPEPSIVIFAALSGLLLVRRFRSASK